MTEHDEQVFIFKWARLNERTIPVLQNLFAIPNGARTKTKTHAIELKKEGLKSGVPDMFFAVPCGEFGGLFIELKRKEGGQISRNQKKWIEQLRNVGYEVVVCRGKTEAIKAILRYLSYDYVLIVKKTVGEIPIVITECVKKNHRERGATVIEYLLLVALVLATSLALINMVGRPHACEKIGFDLDVQTHYSSRYGCLYKKNGKWVKLDNRDWKK